MAPPLPADDRQWPPRSPHEAMVSTPGGRERYRKMLDQTSPSPSPRRGGNRNLPAVNLLQEMNQDEDEDEEDEDEEILQLKLQEIQARLRLKKLKSAKSKKAAEDGVETLDATTSGLAISSQPRSRFSRATTPGANDDHRAPSHAQVQVPASPVRKLQAPQLPKSPSRVLLGIDKGLKARDISLKRAPSYRDSQVGGDSLQTGGYLRRSRTTSNATASSEQSRPLTFNERLASSRNDEASRAERQKKIEGIRSNAFGIGKDEMDAYKKNAVDIPDEPVRPPVFSRAEIMSQAKPAPTSEGIQRSNTMPSLRTISDTNSFALGSTPNSTTTVPQGVLEGQASAFEPYSSFHLSKRILPHSVLARHVSGKKVLNIKDLLKVVKSPDYTLPDVEQDVVIFAILAKKSEPRAHKPTAARNGGNAEDRGKYMVMTLVDLEYELDLFLFNSGFERFWKLTEGTVVAILNPNVMPPPPGRQDTGRFSLVINSDEDSIVEIGKARDLGSCKSVKKTGELCGSWINKKRTEHCEYHSNEAIGKQRATRMEVNGSGFGAKKKKKKKSKEWVDWSNKDDYDNNKAKDYDWESRTQWFISRTMSSADLIDGKDRGAKDRQDRAEFLKRNLEAKEKEREMMKKLGKIGNAAGKEYMQLAGSRATNGASSSNSSSQVPNSQASSSEVPRPDAKSLGLTKSSNIHLSPVKRKRPESSQAGSLASSGRSALGWGTSLKDKLTKMKDGEKLRKEELQPVRKKTRFVTEKGIREAGRESLGNDLVERQVTLEDDDDELVIVK